MANKRRRQKKRVKVFLNFTYVHKTQPGQLPEIFRIILKISTRQMFGCPGLDQGRIQLKVEGGAA